METINIIDPRKPILVVVVKAPVVVESTVDLNDNFALIVLVVTIVLWLVVMIYQFIR